MIADPSSGTWEVRLGDCLDPERGLPAMVDWHPGLTRTHVIMDPPYEAECHGDGRRLLGGKIDRAVLGFDQITEDVRDEIAAHAVRVANGWLLAFCQIEAVGTWRAAFTSAGASWRRGMVWVKPDGSPQLTGDRPSQSSECMALAWAGERRSEWNGGGRRGVYVCNVNDFGRLTSGRPHPTMKPLALMESLIRDFTNPGDLVIDPFAGSGTTGVACKRLGRNFLGWERDPKYHAIAVERINGAREQLEIPPASMVSMEQGVLLAPEQGETDAA